MATAYNDTIFSDYRPNGNHINPSLLWEYDMSTFDWQRSKTIVVQRVVELGWPEDFYGAFDLYGGFEGFREIIKTIPHLSDIDMNFVCHYFNLQKEELLCYTRKLSGQALLKTNDLTKSHKDTNFQFPYSNISVSKHYFLQKVSVLKYYSQITLP